MLLSKFLFHFRSLFRNMKLKYKLLFSYLILIIIPLSIFFIISANRINLDLQERVTYSAAKSYNQTYSFLDYKLHRLTSASNIIITDPLIARMFSPEAAKQDIPHQLKDYYSILSFITSFRDDYDIYKVKLYSDERIMYSEDSYNFFSFQKAQKTDWYSQLLRDKGKICWLPSKYFKNETKSDKVTKEPEVISLITPFRNPNLFSEYIGLVRLDILKSMVIEILKNANSVKNSLTYIVNSNGELFATSDDSLFNTYKININSFPHISNENNSWRIIKNNSQKYLVMSKLINKTDCYMFTVIPVKELDAEGQNLQKGMMALMLIIASVAYLLAFIISFSLTKRINQLIGSMRNMQKGNFVEISTTHSTDEIGELVENYNFMASKITGLLEEKYYTGLELKNAELKALQAQINPHFLYNTMDLIKWMSKKNMNDEVQTLVDSLSSFYKLSLSKGADIIPLRDELLHVQNYFEIQSMRYKNKLTLKLNISDEILDYGILKITMQPIVENAIFHGILNKDDDSGNITISGRLENNIIIISITDDGAGMSEENLQKIHTGKIISKTGSGFGISNINDRFKLFYGAEYGLTYKSSLNEGTTVDIVFPMLKI